jgi:hypothetical protein
MTVIGAGIIVVVVVVVVVPIITAYEFNMGPDTWQIGQQILLCMLIVVYTLMGSIT